MAKTSLVLVTGSSGLIGSETVSFFASRGFTVAGIDNNLREKFFGPQGSTVWMRRRLMRQHKNFRYYPLDIRNQRKINAIFKHYGQEIGLIVHAAAQPSHDRSAIDPQEDFSINATGTLILLEAMRKFCPQAVFILTSTNKVYGDTPNRLPFIEEGQRFEIPGDHRYSAGIDESMGVDHCLHSVFGASKLAADIMTQEYGRYFGLKTGVFRCGCLTGPAQAGVVWHGFLSYLIKCALTRQKYKIYGYLGKQVRDNLHAFDLVNAFFHYFEQPRCGEVYNLGGGRFANLSVLEAIRACEHLTGRQFNYECIDKPRTGDHIWWITDVSKFKSHYPGWDYKFNLQDMIRQIYQGYQERL